jgi:hypothetical protein
MRPTVTSEMPVAPTSSRSVAAPSARAPGTATRFSEHVGKFTSPTASTVPDPWTLEEKI